MNACPLCSGGCLCVTGAKLKRQVYRARMAVSASTATHIERADLCRAEAAWSAHVHGDWREEPVQFTTEEEHALAQVRARHAALIDERRKEMER